MHVRQHIVFLTGAGISAGSGLRTFRDPDGVWNKVDPHDFCTASALREAPGRVLAFYNDRRREVLAAEPNEAHLIIAGLERFHDVTVVTQNVDDLHERAGSRGVVHLHGELTKVTSSRSRRNLGCIRDYPLDRPILPGDLAEDGRVPPLPCAAVPGGRQAVHPRAFRRPRRAALGGHRSSDRGSPGVARTGGEHIQ